LQLFEHPENSQLFSKIYIIICEVASTFLLNRNKYTDNNFFLFSINFRFSQHFYCHTPGLTILQGPCSILFSDDIPIVLWKCWQISRVQI